MEQKRNIAILGKSVKHGVQRSKSKECNHQGQSLEVKGRVGGVAIREQTVAKEMGGVYTSMSKAVLSSAEEGGRAEARPGPAASAEKPAACAQSI